MALVFQKQMGKSFQQDNQSLQQMVRHITASQIGNLQQT